MRTQIFVNGSFAGHFKSKRWVQNWIWIPGRLDLAPGTYYTPLFLILMFAELSCFAEKRLKRAYWKPKRNPKIGWILVYSSKHPSLRRLWVFFVPYWALIPNLVRTELWCRIVGPKVVAELKKRNIIFQTLQIKVSGPLAPNSLPFVLIRKPLLFAFYIRNLSGVILAFGN